MRMREWIRFSSAESHRSSKRIRVDEGSPELQERADFDRIDSLYVDARNWFDLVRMSPRSARRLPLVGSLSSDLGSPIVEDPYGGDSDAYDAAYSPLPRILTD